MTLGSGFGLWDWVLDLSLGTSSKLVWHGIQSICWVSCVHLLVCHLFWPLEGRTLSVLFMATPLYLWGVLTQWMGKVSGVK